MGEEGIHRTAPVRCPKCGKVCDVHAGVREPGKGPEPGDYSICWGCAGIAVFDEKLNLRPLTHADIDVIAADRELCVGLYQAQTSVERYLAEKKGVQN